MASKTDKLFKGMSTKKIANVASMGGEVLDLPNYSGVGHNKTTKNLFDERYGQLSEDNTWTGDNTFEGETKGTKQNTIMGHNRNLTISVGSEAFPNIADMVKLTDTKGITAIHDGSIVGISINYNMGMPSGLLQGVNMKVKVNGSAVWTNAINMSMGTDKEAYFTQARGADTFSAGDTISVCFEGDGAGSVAMSKIIICLEYYYDD